MQQTSFNKDEVYGLIKREMEKMRMDIVRCIYKSVCHNVKSITKTRMKILQDYLTVAQVQNRNDEDEEKFRNELFRIIEVLNESENGLDYKALFDMYLMKLMSASSAQNTKSAVNFMIRQTRDSKRCRELITDKVLGSLVSLLGADTTLDEIKVFLMEIVNNYLEQEFCQNGLCEDHLHALIRNIITR